MALSKPIHMRVSPKFYRKLKTNADAVEKKISAYVRDLIICSLETPTAKTLLRRKNENAK